MEIRWEKSWNALVHPHPVPLSLFHFLFSLSLSLSFPWDWGFPVTWALGFPSLTLSLVLHHISFSPPPTIFSFINSSLCLWLLVSVSFCASLLSLLGFLSLLSVCLQHVCDRAALAGRKARLMATEILSDSGPVQAVPMGSMCFLPLLNAREHPSTVFNPQHSSSTSTQ